LTPTSSLEFLPFVIRFALMSVEDAEPEAHQSYSKSLEFLENAAKAIVESQEIAKASQLLGNCAQLVRERTVP